MKIFKNYWLYFCMFIALFFYSVYKGVQLTNKQIEACKYKGGVPQTERGMYRACLKPENFINIGEFK